MNRRKDTSREDSTDTLDERVERIDGYPFARVLRLRVVQIVCGITLLLMGAVALIEEKSRFNLGMGIPAGVSTVLAAANSIYSSRGFDGYQPSTCKSSSPWARLRFLGPTLRIATGHVLLWGLASVLLLVLCIRAMQTVVLTDDSSTLSTLAVIELLLCLAVCSAMISVLWVDVQYDPD